jgi:small subunit ribosomal protein S36
MLTSISSVDPVMAETVPVAWWVDGNRRALRPTSALAVRCPIVPDRPENRPPRRGRVPAVVLAATVAFLALGAWWSVLAPLGEAPDEPAHLALVLHLADGNPYPDYDGLENQAAIIRLCKTFASATRACPREGEEVTPTSMRRHPVDEAPDKADRPAWNDAGGDERVGQLNQMPQHPPLYYQAMATVLRVERAVLGEPWSTDRELALLRLVNVVLVAPLPLLCWWAARRFGLTDATAEVAAVGVLAVPMLTHIGSTLNNDNLLTLLASIAIALLAGVLRGDRSRRTAVALGAVTALALLTKAFAAVLPPAIVLAYLVGRPVGEDAAESDPPGDETDRSSWSERLRSLAVPLGLAGAVTALGAGWWYLGVRSRTGTFAPSIEDRRLTTDLQPPGFEPVLSEFATEFASKLNQRFWGSFGWYTVRFPSWLALACTVAVATTVIAALLPARDEGGASRLQRLVLLAPMAALGVLVAARAWSLHVTTGGFPFIQGRYLFAGIVGLVVLAASGLRRWTGRWAIAIALAAAAAIQLESVRRCLAAWWGGPGLGPRGQLRALAAWSGWPGELVGLLGVGVVVAGAWLVVEVVRSVGSESR